MGKESSNVESRSQHQVPDKQNSGTTSKNRCEEEVKELFKPEETEETKSNEIKNNDTWIPVAKDREIWKAMETDHAVAAASIH